MLTRQGVSFFHQLLRIFLLYSQEGPLKDDQLNTIYLEFHRPGNALI